MITIEERRHLRELAKKLHYITRNEKWKKREQDWRDLNNHNAPRTLI